MINEVSSIKTILLVDDEVFLRKCLSLLLISEGYKVILAEDGLEAVNLYKDHVNSIDLVLMDIMMPNKDGIVSYTEILEINQDAKIIFMSASSATSLGDLDKITFIQKPFPPSELFVLIRETLNSPCSQNIAG